MQGEKLKLQSLNCFKSFLFLHPFRIHCCLSSSFDSIDEKVVIVMTKKVFENSSFTVTAIYMLMAKIISTIEWIPDIARLPLSKIHEDDNKTCGKYLNAEQHQTKTTSAILTYFLFSLQKGGLKGRHGTASLVICVLSHKEWTKEDVFIKDSNIGL